MYYNCNYYCYYYNTELLLYNTGESLPKTPKFSRITLVDKLDLMIAERRIIPETPSTLVLGVRTSIICEKFYLGSQKQN